MVLANVFDALAIKCCYNDEFSYEKAFEIIQDSLDSHFAPDLWKVLIECRPKLES